LLLKLFNILSLTAQQQQASRRRRMVSNGMFPLLRFIGSEIANVNAKGKKTFHTRSTIDFLLNKKGKEIAQNVGCLWVRFEGLGGGEKVGKFQLSCCYWM